MENRITRFVYDRSPVVVQNALASAFGVAKLARRYGPEQRRWRRFFSTSEAWSEGDLRAYRRERLQHTIRHAWHHVPFYREWFRSAGVHPDDIRDVEDLSKLPLLDKPTVIRAGETMLADDARRGSLLVHPTSGSTGTPLTIYTPPETLHMVYGFTWARLRSGFRFRDPYASFTGLEIVRPGARNPPFWRENWAANQRAFSVFHLREQNLLHYARALTEEPFSYVEGYSGPVYLIADWIERNGFSIANRPKAIFSTSEVLQEQYRSTIERVFGVHVRDQYSQGEFCASITEYACGHMHEDIDYGVIELLPVGMEDGLVRAELVCTSLYNDAWPLIRYRVGDLCLYDPDERCAHGRPGRVIRRLEGRTGRFFALADGTRVTNISVIAKRCRNVRLLQVIQDNPGAIEVRVVPAEGFDPRQDKDLVVHQFQRKLGTDLLVDVTLAAEPLLTRRGKFLSILHRTDVSAT